MPEPKSRRSPVSTGDTAPGASAQAEFDKYKARMGSPYPAWPGVPGGWPPGFTLPMPGFATPGWAPAPPAMGTPPAPGFGLGAPPADVVAGSLTERLRYSLRLGVDVLNAGLAGGLRVLGGVAALPGALAPWGHECGCPHGGHEIDWCGCADCCCGIDCCCDDGCCHPGVSGCDCHCGHHC